MKWVVLAVLMVLAGRGNAEMPMKKNLILCHYADAKDVIIILNSHAKFNRTLNCIQADFIADLTPCAPSGGWGLSAPTGIAALVEVSDGWQTLMNHTGGAMLSAVSATDISFHWHFRTFGENKNGASSFSVSRINGEAILERPGKPSVSYKCKVVTTKF